MAKNDLSGLAADIERSYGKGSAAMGGLQRALKTIPTGSLALDYELGIGGWPLGHCVGVFGPRDIGKSSVVGLNAIRNAQAMGLNCAIVAVEPNFDHLWAQKNGVNTEDLLVVYPQSGEEAFSLTLKIVRSGAVDLVIFDSIGAIISEVELKDEGKPRVGGQAGLITFGIKSIAPIAYRNHVCVIFINQVRDDMKSMYAGVVKQPGGNALEHHESIIVQMRKGSDRYTVKRDGTDVQVGQQLVALILRNKCAEGSGQKASFDNFFMETTEYPFGIDVISDTINTAKRLGIIKSRSEKSSWYDLPDGSSHNGFKAVGAYLRKTPAVMEQIREQVLRKMVQRNTAMLEISPELIEEMANEDDD